MATGVGRWNQRPVGTVIGRTQYAHAVVAVDGVVRLSGPSQNDRTVRLYGDGAGCERGLLIRDRSPEHATRGNRRRIRRFPYSAVSASEINGVASCIARIDRHRGSAPGYESIEVVV